MVTRFSVAHIFGNIWSVGKNAAVILVAQSILLSTNSAVIANPVSPPRPGALAPSSSTYTILKAAPNVPAGKTMPPGTIPLAMINSILGGTNSTNFSKTIIDVSNLSNATLNLGSANLVNMSSLYFVSSNQNLHNVTVKAQNIYNAPGALITTNLAGSGITDAASYNQALSLSLVASGAILNAGTISSSGSLSLSAPKIINALPEGVNSSLRPTISAQQAVNFFAPDISNAGLVSSAQANVTFANNIGDSVQSILLNNTGGVIQALNGAISFRDSSFIEKFNTDIVGGDFLAKNLVVNSGDGIINISVNDISLPVLDIYGGEVFASSQSSLNLGKMVLTGDPLIFSGGDVFLVADEKTGNTNAPFRVVAQRDIINLSCTAIDGGSGSVVYEAGRNIDLSGIGTISARGTISLDANGGNLIVPSVITSSYEPSYFPPNGQAQGLIDYSVGLFAKFSVSAGSISSPRGTVSVRAGGDLINGVHQPGTNPGSISIHSVVGARDTLLDAGGGSITADVLTGGGGRMWVLAKDNLNIGLLTNNGTVFDGFYQADNRIQGGASVTLGAISANAASTVIFSSGNISLLENISAANTQGFGAYFNATSLGGNVTLMSSQVNVSSGYFEIAAPQGTVNIPQNLVVNGDATKGNFQGASVNLVAQILSTQALNISCNGAGSGAGGGIQLVGRDTLAVDTSNILLTANGGDSGDGGSVTIRSGSGLTINSDRFSVTAGNNGNGGSITLDASSQNPTSKLVVVGPLNADGNGTGNGGSISLYNGRSPFVLGKGGDASSVSAQSGLQGGNGGTIVIESGDNLTVNSKSIQAGARGASGNGGNISLVAGVQGDTAGATETYDGTLSVTGSLNVDAKGTGNGGSILLVNGKNPLIIGSDGNVPSVYARSGIDGGDGGSITLQSGGDITVDARKLSVGVRGGDGYGGRLSFSAGYMIGNTLNGGLTVNGNLNASGKGKGDGGFIGLSAYATATGDGGGIGALAARAAAGPQASGPGAIQINGNLIADAGKEGKGGQISLSAQSIPSGDAVPDSIPSITVTGSQIRANGGSTKGDGGSIQITTGGLIDLAAKHISASARNNGNGGFVDFRLTGSGDSTATALSFNGDLRADGKGVVDSLDPENPENTIPINALGGTVTFSNGGSGDLSITANGVISAEGSKGVVTFSNSNGKLRVNAAGLLGRIEASAKDVSLTTSVASKDLSLGNISASDGNVTIDSKGNVTLLPGYQILQAEGDNLAPITVSMRAGKDVIISETSTINANGLENQSGGNIRLFAGTAAKGIIRINGTLLANGNEAGDGGKIELNYASAETLVINGVLHADADQGKSGDITIRNRADTSMKIILNGELTTATNNGQPASLFLEPFSKTENDVSLKLGVDAKFISNIHTDGRKVEIFIPVDNVTLQVTEIKAVSEVSISLIGSNTSLEIQESGKISCDGSIFITAANINNFGIIESTAKGSFSRINFDTPTGTMKFVNSGTVQLASTDDKGGTIGFVSTGQTDPDGNELSIDSVILSGDGSLSSNKLSVNCSVFEIAGNTVFFQDSPTKTKSQSLSPITLDVNSLTIQPGKSLTFRSSQLLDPEIPFVQIGKSLSSMQIDGIFKSEGFVRIQNTSTGLNISGNGDFLTGITARPAVVAIQGTGKVSVSLNSIQATVIAQSQNGLQITTQSGGLQLGNIANKSDGNITISIGESDSSSSVLRITPQSRITNTNGSITIQEGHLGKIKVGFDSVIRSQTSSVGIFIGSNSAPSSSLQLPATQWKLASSAKIGTTVFVDGRMPEAVGDKNIISINNPSTHVFIVDRGTSDTAQVMFEGSVNLIAGLIPISFQPHQEKIIVESIAAGKMWCKENSILLRDGQDMVLQKGQVLMEFTRRQRLLLPHGWSVSVEAGTVLYVSFEHDTLVVRNLVSQQNGVRFICHGQVITLGPSCQLSSGNNEVDPIPVRRTEDIQSSKSCSISEFSLAYFLANNTVLKQVRVFSKQDEKDSTRLFNKISKFAVCYGLVKGQEPYSIGKRRPLQ